ncbi:MAG: hypothetical protein HY569_03170 [Candidatus Magasanikbacteria bacterium]|nr:hypothetical protein [Candidatus Magasanikbacteria bacterium]
MKTENKKGGAPELTKETSLDNKPAFIARGPANIYGEETKMLTFIFRTPPCAYNKCTMCGFDNNASCSVIHENIVKQYQDGIKTVDLKGVKKLDFPTAGSFYNDNEMSSKSRAYLFKEAAKLPEVKHVMVETRVDYLTLEKVIDSQKLLRSDQKLELAIGLESANDKVRNIVLHKGLTKTGYEHFADICQETGSRMRSYILIGSPTLTESEVIEDTVETARYAYEVANARGIEAFLAIKPMFIPKGTGIEKQFEEGKYQLPTLWNVIEIVKKITKLKEYQPNSIWVGMYDENLSSDRFTHNCGKCDKKVAEAIIRYNGTQDLKEFEGLRCECKGKDN